MHSFRRLIVLLFPLLLGIIPTRADTPAPVGASSAPDQTTDITFSRSSDPNTEEETTGSFTITGPWTIFWKTEKGVRITLLPADAPLKTMVSDTSDMEVGENATRLTGLNKHTGELDRYQGEGKNAEGGTFQLKVVGKGAWTLRVKSQGTEVYKPITDASYFTTKEFLSHWSTLASFKRDSDSTENQEEPPTFTSKNGWALLWCSERRLRITLIPAEGTPRVLVEDTSESRNRIKHKDSDENQQGDASIANLSGGESDSDPIKYHGFTSAPPTVGTEAQTYHLKVEGSGAYRFVILVYGSGNEETQSTAVSPPPTSWP